MIQYTSWANQMDFKKVSLTQEGALFCNIKTQRIRSLNLSLKSCGGVGGWNKHNPVHPGNDAGWQYNDQTTADIISCVCTHLVATANDMPLQLKVTLFTCVRRGNKN